MDHPNSKDIKEAFVVGLTLIGAMAARKIMEKTWVIIAKEQPPKNPEDKEVSWKDAIIWTVCTGAIIGLTKLVVRRNAYVGAEKWLKT